MKNFSATITTRYNAGQEEIYNEVMDVVKEHSIPKSTAQFLLVQKGCKHKNNPSPLVPPKPKIVVKEKVVIKEVPVDRIVYKDKPGKTVKKVVYKDRVVTKPKPKDTMEHLADDRIVDIPKLSGKLKGIQSVDKATQQETPTSKGSGWIWLLSGIVALCGWKIGSLYYGQNNGNNGVQPTHTELI